MSTAFTSLPILDLSPLRSPWPSQEELEALASRLFDIFRTVGFAYVVNAPISLSHEQIFSIAENFFSSSQETKMSLAKNAFIRGNPNTYRGFFPVQKGSDNLKEGFEIGPTPAPPASSHRSNSTIVLTEPNVFPNMSIATTAQRLHSELQSLSTTLLALLAVSLGKAPEAFTNLLTNSVSTLRLLHYPAIAPPQPKQELNCTPHTDSGLLTLLHQDSTGGLEVRNAAGQWIPAPYVPGSIVVNIGDLMAKLSGDIFVATMHRVRSHGKSRYSVPFFCEPGIDAVVPNPTVDGTDAPTEVRYEDYVLGKMGMWVEFQEAEEGGASFDSAPNISVEVGA